MLIERFRYKNIKIIQSEIFHRTTEGKSKASDKLAIKLKTNKIEPDMQNQTGVTGHILRIPPTKINILRCLPFKYLANPIEKKAPLPIPPQQIKHKQYLVFGNAKRVKLNLELTIGTGRVAK